MCNLRVARPGIVGGLVYGADLTIVTRTDDAEAVTVCNLRIV